MHILLKSFEEVLNIRTLQDWKLNTRKWGCLRAVCQTLTALAEGCGAQNYLATYQRDLGNMVPSNSPETLPWNKKSKSNASLNHINRLIACDPAEAASLAF